MLSLEQQSRIETFVNRFKNHKEYVVKTLYKLYDSQTFFPTAFFANVDEFIAIPLTSFNKKEWKRIFINNAKDIDSAAVFVFYESKYKNQQVIFLTEEYLGGHCQSNVFMKSNNKLNLHLTVSNKEIENKLFGVLFAPFLN